jgi:cytochrome c oxidase cbb3-type subunit 3
VKRRHQDELLEHDADGIREFDNDLPRWWLYGFYFTIAFAVVYLVNYHVLPNPLFGAATVAEEYAVEMREAAASAPAASASAAEVAVLTDAASLSKGQAIYESQTHPCAACHRPDLGGLVGPNLTDHLWLHGCGMADLVKTIRLGYPTKGMLPYGGGPPLEPEQVQQLASYIVSKRGSNPPDARAPEADRDVECK